MSELDALIEQKAGTLEAVMLQNAAIASAASDQNTDALRAELREAQEQVTRRVKGNADTQEHAQQQMFLQRAQMRDVTENLQFCAPGIGDT